MGIWIKLKSGEYECNLCRGKCICKGEMCNYKYCPRCGVRMNLMRSLKYAEVKHEG